MKVIGPFVYILEYENRSLLSVKDDAESRKGFSAPVTQKGHKIYAVYREGRLIYVGVTNQPIGSRLRYGENPAPETGHHGYKWTSTPGKYDLFVWTLPENLEASMDQEETIEAEIAYQIRQETRQWPSGQTEIHFHKSSQLHRSIAERMLANVASYYTQTKKKHRT